ncbi:MAG: hypothetical protein QOF36_2619 [Microbacteriaceae bacterium]|jgi:hypothetical protein|nr:hypothetical protein [Microbacteriaceae bacterium]
MREAIRCTVYTHMPTPGGPAPMTVATFTDNLIVSGEALAEQMRVPGVFVATEIFETDAPDEATATIEVVRRMEGSEEHNMAVMYWWIVGYLHNASREAYIGLTGPNPLTEEQNVEVLEQIRAHPLYAEQRISTPTVDESRFVILDAGEITTEDT